MTYPTTHYIVTVTKLTRDDNTLYCFQREEFTDDSARLAAETMLTGFIDFHEGAIVTRFKDDIKGFSGIACEVYYPTTGDLYRWHVSCICDAGLAAENEAIFNTLIVEQTLETYGLCDVDDLVEKTGLRAGVVMKAIEWLIKRGKVEVESDIPYMGEADKVGQVRDGYSLKPQLARFYWDTKQRCVIEVTGTSGETIFTRVHKWGYDHPDTYKDYEYCRMPDHYTPITDLQTYGLPA